MTLPLRPNTEIVAAAWLGSIPGLSPGMVAMSLPDPSAWPVDGFVLVGPVVGGTMLDIPAVSPVVQVDCFAVHPSSAKPPWGRVDLLVEHIRAHTRQRDQAVRDVTISASGVTYPPARVAGARFLSEPRRGYGDPADWAHKVFDLALTWTETEALYS